jgi:arginase family enzyme
MDIIEINPLADVKNTTAELAVEMVISLLGGAYGDYERNYILQQKP